MEQRLKDRICFLAAVLLVSASLCYWFAFSFNAYATFHSYWDLAITTYGMYYHIHYPGLVHGLQYLVFDLHLAPDQLLVLPIFYLFPSSLTLLLVQATALSLTGLLVFLIARRLLKRNDLALLLCLAYLMSPGLHGILLVDYHVEFLIVPFFLLTFYFFMERRRIPMLAALLLLLGTVETAPYLGVVLGIGLLLYGIRYCRENREVRSERARLALLIIVLSLAALAAYGCAESLLSSAYAGGAYPNLPPPLQVSGFATAQVAQLTSVLAGTASGTNYVPPVYVAYAVAVVLLGFGISALFVPEITALLILPWLVEGFALDKVTFFLTWYQYFSYVIGGVMVASILGFMAVGNGSNRFGSALKPIPKGQRQYWLARVLLMSSLVVFIISPLFLISNSFANPFQQLFLQTTGAERMQMAQLHSMIALVPGNASLVAPIDALSQLSAREYLFPMPGGRTTPWFTPQYLLVDANTSALGSPPDPESEFNQTRLDRYVLAEGSYYLYAKNGTAELYRLSNYSDSDVP